MERTYHRSISVGSFLFALLSIGLLAYWQSLFQVRYHSAASTNLPLSGPVLAQTVTTMDEVADLTAGKLIPQAAAHEAPPEPPGDHIRGKSDAPYSMIQYASLKSSYSRLYHAPLISVFNANKEKLNWIYRPYPSPATEDYRISQAGECAASFLGNEGFWSYFDALMAVRSIDDQVLIAQGTRLGLKASDLQGCLNRNAMMERVADSKQLAQAAMGLYVTPSIVFRNNITGEIRIVEGINTSTYLQSVFDAMAGR